MAPRGASEAHLIQWDGQKRVHSSPSKSVIQLVPLSELTAALYTCCHLAWTSGCPSAGHRTPHLGHLQLPFSDTFYCPHLPLGTQLNPDYTTSLASKFNISPSLCKVQIFLNDNYKSLLSDHSLFTGLQLVTDTGQVQPISKMFCPHL
jgi:hypothetical protein